MSGTSRSRGRPDTWPSSTLIRRIVGLCVVHNPGTCCTAAPSSDFPYPRSLTLSAPGFPGRSRHSESYPSSTVSSINVAISLQARQSLHAPVAYTKRSFTQCERPDWGISIRVACLLRSSLHSRLLVCQYVGQLCARLLLLVKLDFQQSLLTSSERGHLGAYCSHQHSHKRSPSTARRSRRSHRGQVNRRVIALFRCSYGRSIYGQLEAGWGYFSNKMKLKCKYTGTSIMPYSYM